MGVLRAASLINSWGGRKVVRRFASKATCYVNEGGSRSEPAHSSLSGPNCILHGDGGWSTPLKCC